MAEVSRISGLFAGVARYADELKQGGVLSGEVAGTTAVSALIRLQTATFLATKYVVAHGGEPAQRNALFRSIEDIGDLGVLVGKATRPLDNAELGVVELLSLDRVRGHALASADAFASALGVLS